MVWWFILYWHKTDKKLHLLLLPGIVVFIRRIWQDLGFLCQVSLFFASSYSLTGDATVRQRTSAIHICSLLGKYLRCLWWTRLCRGPQHPAKCVVWLQDSHSCYLAQDSISFFPVFFCLTDARGQGPISVQFTDAEQRWSLSIRQSFQLKSCSFFLVVCVKRASAKQYCLFAKYALITAWNRLSDLLTML